MPQWFVRASDSKSSPVQATQSKPAAEKVQARMKKAGYKNAHIEQTTKGNGGYWFRSKTQ